MLLFKFSLQDYALQVASVHRQTCNNLIIQLIYLIQHVLYARLVHIAQTMETLQAYPAHLGLIALLALISAFNVQLDMIALLGHLVFN